MNAVDLPIDEKLVAYFAARDADRATLVANILAVMTKRERALVREVAVMANVAGWRPGERVAKDSAVLADVIIRCVAMPDLYPTIARLCRIAVRRAQDAAEENP